MTAFKRRAFRRTFSSSKIMKYLVALGICVAAFTVTFGQGPSTVKPESTNPRVVVTNTIPSPESVKRPTASPSPATAPVAVPAVVQPRPQPAPAPVVPLTYLSFGQIKGKIAEAKRTLQTRPMTTAMSDPVGLPEVVQIAYYDVKTKEIAFVSIGKDAFLTRGVPFSVISTNGRQLTSRTIRANGVNTPVVLIDDTGTPHQPLMVQYPVVRNGVFIETAYYMSTHPGITTPEVVAAGQLYVRNTIDVARNTLREKGFKIDPMVADMAERLAAVEHVDHLRFRTEPHINIYSDVFTLYALNEGQTYRYAVSSAGAGGMIQMIPSTYRIMRARYPSVNLMPDFVEGMRNHPNAAQAMLLYIQMTWDDLFSRASVRDALATGIATPSQLMAAGYNSNPSRLPGYITRGGAGWANLIPRETKIYLQIYDSLERAIPMKPRTN
jgi:hypothetical protein